MKVLLATDGSTFSEAAIEGCIQLAKTGSVSAVRVISVFEPHVPIAAEPLVISTGYYEHLDNAARHRARMQTSHAVELMSTQFDNAAVEISTAVRMGDPPSAIVDVANEWGADLIIVGSHGRGFLGRLALGSVSDAVVHTAECSVLVARR